MLKLVVSHQILRLCSVSIYVLVLTMSDSLVSSWNVAHQAPLSMEFQRQEYLGRWSFPSPEDLAYPGIEPGSLHLLHQQADSLPLAPPGKTHVSAQSYALIFI